MPICPLTPEEAVDLYIARLQARGILDEKGNFTHLANPPPVDPERGPIDAFLRETKRDRCSSEKGGAGTAQLIISADYYFIIIIVVVES